MNKNFRPAETLPNGDVTVALSQGHEALVCSEGWRRVSAAGLEKSAWSLTKNGNMTYARASVEGVKYYLHRVVFAAVKGQKVDHKDGNSLNCRLSNLQDGRLNERNVGLSRRNKSGFKGVFRHGSKTWVASAYALGKRHIVGTYGTKEEAARARDAYVRGNFPENQLYNFPNTGERGMDRVKAG